ncbi:SUMF1/EgtB/PvdO family nonheme iron enzyme [Leifsonia sp. Le1]|uniref:SUMF1/EgtB/PvdO family nonheme iron enzyme n=1 Tax=Leifsonia sp. Le1 TaxID=3404918 RepID=UPI003EBB55C3
MWRRTTRRRWRGTEALQGQCGADRLIDAHAVTKEQFDVFVYASGFVTMVQRTLDATGFASAESIDALAERHPVARVSFEHASAHSSRVGRRLPTEVEEYAGAAASAARDSAGATASEGTTRGCCHPHRRRLPPQHPRRSWPGSLIRR